MSTTTNTNGSRMNTGVATGNTERHFPKRARGDPTPDFPRGHRAPARSTRRMLVPTILDRLPFTNITVRIAADAAARGQPYEHD
ncbi:MAG: hypothetical protein VX475_14640, partial [Myxococcota bacterium]|nr:hypothetical protein [Myxococcota bacterium]